MADAPPPVVLTERAADRLKTLISREGNDNLKFRVSVSGGGCSGFSYGFDFAETGEPGDLETEQHGVKVLIDGMAMMYVLGAEIDYKESLVGAAFSVSNPNASSHCGCGSSFSI
ncbi:iron-sulfur cluster insertion protein ErpA [Rhodothalassium salexigens]|uniref:iron-sulfur cluster insertion protein ErpA n=1 Tax=Rhodothalassium salexigens TaxID=1086 RepID=UPI00191285DD|nr:iron-sulfur cluster insertion protein ErpA [Rhodothalassium salexigens]MBK5911779.1 iron-sulfur cluster insertion protein ErpA [Rhodothalassium salexigens]MBK5920433.1 iron-sulfur cluster insertion protein ErpA [Rhodothalassium salexigens]